MTVRKLAWSEPAKVRETSPTVQFVAACGLSVAMWVWLHRASVVLGVHILSQLRDVGKIYLSSFSSFGGN